jgi:thymidylate synthase (FAD)
MSLIQRVSVPELDKMLGIKHSVLDKGFVRVIDYMGDDSAVVQAARVSYGEGTKNIRQDAALINYLIKHKHTSPFEMCEIKLHIKLPIFIARQWIRHRTANVNEVSARYSVLPKEFYIPDVQNIATQSKDNKQGRGDVVSKANAEQIIDILTKDSHDCYNNYLKLLGGEITSSDEDKLVSGQEVSKSEGLARELARINLSLNFYTEWYWKIDLHNLLHFLNLRLHPHAQFEIREYARIIFEIVQKWCPITTRAFEDNVLNSKTFSSKAIEAISAMIKGAKGDADSFGLSKREYNEILEALKINS